MSLGLPDSWQEFCSSMDNSSGSWGIDQAMAGFYEKMFKVWYDAFAITQVSCSYTENEIKDSFRKGRYLLSEDPLTVNPGTYREVLTKVIAAAADYPTDRDLGKILQLPGLQGEALKEFLRESASFNMLQLQNYLEKHGWDASIEIESELLAFLLFAALTPFYVSMAASVSTKDDLSLWREGFCPVCGQKPAMAILRAEDGVRILECWLCHIQWQFPRLECPFCRNGDFEKIHHFYADEYPGRRVQLCEKCKSYLKTVVGKEIGREVILELENIFTVELDLIARREGYHPGGDLAPLS